MIGKALYIASGVSGIARLQELVRQVEHDHSLHEAKITALKAIDDERKRIAAETLGAMADVMNAPLLALADEIRKGME